jgi:hypothetical protein
MCKAVIEEKRDSLIAKENKTVMMGPSTMDASTREWCDLTRMEILQRRWQAASCGGPTSAGGAPARGGGYGGVGDDLEGRGGDGGDASDVRGEDA